MKNKKLRLSYTLLNLWRAGRIDDAIYRKFNHLPWFLGKMGYIVCSTYNNKKRGTLYLHREILKCKKGDIADHINGNKLDNRIENLRIVTKRINQVNQKRRRDNTSGYKGVCWVESRKKWVAQISFNGKHKFLGYFSTPQGAFEAYKKVNILLNGKYAKNE